jgi:hypothetical protein
MRVVKILPSFYWDHNIVTLVVGFESNKYRIMFENWMLERLIKCNRCLSIDQEMIPHGNGIDAHEQDLVVNDELLLLMQKAFAECTLSTHGARYRLCFQSVVPTSRRTVVPRTAPDTPTTVGIISCPVVCRQFNNLSFSAANLDNHVQRMKSTGHVSHKGEVLAGISIGKD